MGTARTGQGEPLFRLAAAWRACPRTGGETAVLDTSAGPLFAQAEADDTAPARARRDRAAAARGRSSR